MVNPTRNKRRPPKHRNGRTHKTRRSISSDRRASQKRRIAKSLLANKCACCGYSTCSRALEFHHINKKDKRFNISMNILNYPWVQILLEIMKCVLVCANCHFEIEEGIRKLRKKDLSNNYYKLVKDALNKSRGRKNN